MKFESLLLCEPLLRALEAAGHEQPTPIQQQAIPPILQGRDLVGCAQTGTGKTAAFALPTLQQLLTVAEPPSGASRRRQRSGRRAIRALVLSPTRELAAQIGQSLETYGRFTHLRHAVIFGGVRQGAQVRALEMGVDVLVATPGRLLDLVGQGFVQLADVEILVLDEADQMLDMGFIHDLRKIVAHVANRRQTLMFSATMPPEIRQLASKWLRRPVEVQVTPVASTPERVSQSVYFVERPRKAATLSWFLREISPSKTLVFSRTRRGADRIVRGLQRDGIRAVAIHGDKSQSRREAVIREFNSASPPVLVATDVAARGLDFSDVMHVVNYDLPETPETYVHRIGRTARAGASGRAVSFCGSDEHHRLRMIERLTGQRVQVVETPQSPAANAASRHATLADGGSTSHTLAAMGHGPEAISPTPSGTGAGTGVTDPRSGDTSPATSPAGDVPAVAPKTQRRRPRRRYRRGGQAQGREASAARDSRPGGPRRRVGKPARGQRRGPDGSTRNV